MTAEDVTACYVYGVVPDDRTDDAVIEDLRPVGNPEARVGFVRHRGLAALVSEVPTGKAIGTPEDLRSHAQVLDAMAAAESPVLPFRFGTVLRDTDSVVEELLTEGREDFTLALERLENKAQFTLRAQYVQDAVLREVLEEHEEVRRLREELADVPEAAGYDQRVRLGERIVNAIEAKRQTDSQEVERRLEPLAHAMILAEPAAAEGLVTASFLMEHGQREAFEEAVEELAEQWRERAQLRLLGPMAPYDFVGDALSADKEAAATADEGGG
jgi:hypothetical protein